MMVTKASGMLLQYGRHWFYLCMSEALTSSSFQIGANSALLNLFIS